MPAHDSVLVNRLLSHYDPFRQFFNVRPTLTEVRKARMVEGYAPTRPEPSDQLIHCDTELLWDLGRLKFFVELLEKDGKLDPIEGDWRWDNGAPVRFLLVDGHHRLCAAKLARCERIDLDYSGPVDFLKYLKGERELPKEYA